MRERFRRLAVKAVMMTALLVAPAELLAVPAKPVRRTVTLADGTKVEATLQGDEHLHFFRLDDGRVAIPQDGGRYRLSTLREVREVWTERMQEARERQTARLQKARGGELLALTRQADTWQGAGSNALRAKAHKANSIYQGQKRGLVILVNFSDLTMSVSNPQSTYNDFFNKVGYNQGGMTGSVHDYFYSQSYGQFDLQFDVVGPITLRKPHGYYGADMNGSKDVYVHEMVRDACQAVDAQVDFSRYDWDGDGWVDQIFFVYAGYGQNFGAPDDCIWPHEHTIAYQGLKLDGTGIGTYACSCELRGTEGKQMDGIGTACHEFTHCMGIMDHYDTSGDNFGMGHWDVMCSGSYNNDSRTPSAYTAYERWVSGWLDPVEINKATYVQAMKPLEDEPEAYVLYNDYASNEFYLLENRQQKGWDGGQDGHGLLVVHVDYDEYAWRSNSVNTIADHQRMTIIPADGLLSLGTHAGDPWPGTSRKTSLTDVTSPAATVYNAGPNDYSFMGKPLTEIAEDEARGHISFACMRGTLPTPVLNAAATDITSSSFSIGWNAVEGATSYEVSLRERPAPYANPEQACVLREDFAKCWSKSTSLSSIANKLDNYTAKPGWTGSRLFTSSNYLKMGQGSNMGELTTPMLDTPLADGLTIVLTLTPFGSSNKMTGSVSILLKSGNMQGSYDADGAQTLIFTTPSIEEAYQVQLSPSTICYISRFEVYDGVFSSKQLGIDDDDEDSGKQSIPMAGGKRSVKRNAITTTTFTTTEPHYTFTGLTSTSKYFVSVRALTDLGPSKWSAERQVALDQTAIFTPTGEQTATSSVWYNLQGQPVARPQRGIYIHDGKKVLVK